MNNQVWDELQEIRIDSFARIIHNNTQEKYVSLLMTRVTELCQDSLLLLRQGGVASAPIVLRSSLESYVDLMCVINDSDHINEMNKSYDFHKTKKQGGKVKFKELTNISEKFKLAGESKIYDGFYSHLCRSSHGNLEMLINFHLVGGRISIGHDPDITQVKDLENQAITLAATALIYGLKFLGGFEEQVTKLEGIQKCAGSR